MISIHGPRKIRFTLFFCVFAAIGMLAAAPAAAQPDDSVLETTEQSTTFSCEPGSIPETSRLREFREDVRKAVDSNYTQRYPDTCKMWSKEYVVETENGSSRYNINLVKYEGGVQPALVTVVQDGERVAYSEVVIDGEAIGSTNPDGRFRMEIPENFELTVRTSDADLKLES